MKPRDGSPGGRTDWGQSIAASALVATIGALSVGVFLLDAACQVTFANPWAEELARRRDGLKIVAGRLEMTGHEGPALHRLLARFAGKDPPGPIVRAIPRSSSRPLTLALVKLEGLATGVPGSSQFAAFVADPNRRIRTAAYAVAEIYQLTAAERRVVQHLLEGKTLKEVAKATGVGYSTTRSHLISIFRKTDVSRQGALIALCMASSINLRTDQKF